MLKIGDKIKYVKASSFIEMPLGTILTVTDINGTAIAVQGDYKVNGCVIGQIKGIMSYDNYENHFEKIVEPKTIVTEWSEWKTKGMCDINNIECDPCEHCTFCLACSYADTLLYRHNNKKVMVKITAMSTHLYPNMPNGKVLTACASCHPDDTFDLNKGIKIALEKINKQIAKRIIKVTDENLKKY
jgi:hypothetical protein